MEGKRTKLSPPPKFKESALDIRNKAKGEARAILCANGDPDTVVGIKRVLNEQYGDQRDFATNLASVMSIKRGDKNNLKFYGEVKELNTKLKANLTANPLSGKDIIDPEIRKPKPVDIHHLNYFLVEKQIYHKIYFKTTPVQSIILTHLKIK